MNEDMWVNHGLPLTGEGIQMAWDLGADQDGMCPQFTSFMPGGKLPMTPEAMGLFGLIGWSLPYLWVNQHGERFLDEGNGDTTHICNSIDRQKNKCCYTIIDSATAKYLDENGPDVAGYIHRKTGTIEEMVKGAIEKDADNIFMADSIGDLARQMDIKVYTIGVGTTGRAPFRTRDAFGRERIGYEWVRLDEALLKRIARETDGQYFNVRDPKGLERAMAEIDRLIAAENQNSECRIQDSEGDHK